MESALFAHQTLERSEEMRRHQNAKTKNHRMISQAEDYLHNQRGLSQRTIYHCWRFADRFLQFRFAGETRDLDQITPTDIVRFMQQLLSRGKPFRDKTPPTHLRNFFRFLFKSGKTKVNLTPSLPRVAQKYAPKLPRLLTPEPVETLIAAVRTNTAIASPTYGLPKNHRA
jgi:integrase/recombinase XerD